MANMYDLDESTRMALCNQVSLLHSAAQKVDSAVSYEIKQLDKCLDLAEECRRIAEETVRYISSLNSSAASNTAGSRSEELNAANPANIMYLGNCEELNCEHFSWSGDSYRAANTECYCFANHRSVFRSHADIDRILCPLGKIQEET